jgi:hypothetical protein
MGEACYLSHLLPEPALALPVCPFCKGAVPADTLRFGGNCPHCMLEIPGEEAPTDPGIQARQRKEQEDKAQQAKKQRKNRFLGGLSLLVLFALGGAGVWAYQTQQEALTYEMDEYYETPLSELQHAPVPQVAVVGGPEAGTVDNGTGRPTGRKPPEVQPIGTGNPDAGTGPRRPTFQAGADAQAPTVATTSGSGVGDVGAGQIKVSFVGSDKVLTDNDEIIAMAKAVINASSPQLQTCYNQRLKAVEGLKGAWEVAFTIGKDGSAKRVAVTGVNGSDPELESCMNRQVSAWKFQKIVKDQPIKKTYRFGAGSW